MSLVSSDLEFLLGNGKLQASPSLLHRFYPVAQVSSESFVPLLSLESVAVHSL